MEEEEDEKMSSEVAVPTARGVRAHSSLEEGESRTRILPSADSVDTAISLSLSSNACSKYTERTFKKSTFSRSGTSSSSQDSEATSGTTHSAATSGQYLAAARVESARSMESLRPNKDSSPGRPGSSCATVHRTHRSFLTASERDVRESRGAPARRALSGEDVGSAGATAAERRRGLFASTERRALQQLSLPPPERRLTILSPHSPMAAPHELAWPLSGAGAGIRTRRKKGMVLPKLILPRSDSDQSEVFFDRCLIE